MTDWRVLVVDDDDEIRSSTTELVERHLRERDEDVTVLSVGSFDEGLDLLDGGDFDLVILDVRDQERADATGIAAAEGGDDATAADVGLDVFKQLRASRFIPIIFQTGVANLVRDLEKPPFVFVVSKTDPVESLLNAVDAAFDSTLPAIHRALRKYVTSVEHEFMADFVEQHWEELMEPHRKGDLAHLLTRRLGLSLNGGASVLNKLLGGGPDVQVDGDIVHPMRYYILPAVPAEHVGGSTTGDLIHGDRVVTEEEANGSAWYVVLTPACDLAQGKADFVVLAEAVPLESFPEYEGWRDAEQAKLADETEASTKAVAAAEKKLLRLLSNNRDGKSPERWNYLPGVWGLPDLVVDFQKIVHVPKDQVEAYERVATLDSPYSESLIARFTRYVGRLGTPDLDVTVPVDRLRANLTP
jgi:CheY-like chemotaxis protein